MFKDVSTSYSQFLQSKEHRAQLLTESTDSGIDNELFKRSVFLNYQYLYVTKRWQNWLYRLIFFGFSFLFIFLAWMIFTQTTNYTCGIYFKNCFLLKNWVNFISFILAAGSFMIGYKIHPEKDAIQYLVGKVEKELKSPAKQLQIEFHAFFAKLQNNWIDSHQPLWTKKRSL